ncbi:MAG: bifunctional phosphoribosyl-AMP cyclohydrolase/phosphoribosyl-ATP diphosphatase HisIE [Lachnospiraceae bacterium]|nr:bifunctional phosphoribosyl-AMP cyclohydrolase/phosphoribosyl-ATP diphosphatase HisIE [Lachnospiraceae bacterium]
MKKKLIAYINAENEIRGSVINRAEKYDHEGADQLFLYNYSKDEATRDSFLALAKKIIHSIDIPVVLGLYVSKFEDIKKALYTGAVRVVVKETILDNQFAIKEATDRFGADRIFVEVDSHGDFSNVKDIQKLKDMGVYGILLKHVVISDTLIENMKKSEMSIIIRDALIRNDLAELMSLDQVLGVATNHFEHKVIMKAKYALKDKGIDVETYESMLSFSDFKLNSDGMIPVIAQDYRTGEVLMMAYMNEEAFEKTIKTGRMTYWSRSREELWCKGDTSGHYQFVKSLTIDCDNDTLLARVHQVGAACHTGNRSCFFTTIMKKEINDRNPFNVFEEVYNIIKSRKERPKEGSYTNYLFDKGLDKILKKCGEEATEMVIAAKNPDAEELKYEISDFLYHMMVLMVECGLDWDDVVKELSNRR